VKKPTQNQTPISWRLMVDGMVDFPGIMRIGKQSSER
jgi:hypothetical protein